MRLMRTRLIVVIVACALMATSACSSDSEPAAPEKPLKGSDMAKALVRANDFPDKDFKRDDAGASAVSDEELFPDDSCDDKVTAVKADVSAKAAFVAPSGLTYLTHTVKLYKDGKVNQVVDAYNTFLAECRLVRVPGGQVTVGPLRLGSLTADNVQTAQILFDKGGALTEADLVVLYSGDLVSTLTLVGPRPTPRSVLDALVRDALGKLEALAEGVI
jgi:hypothetical protein